MRSPIMKYFTYGHLPEPLQSASQPICELAERFHAELPDSAERQVGLRKLLEAKDAFVRAALEKGEQENKRRLEALRHEQDCDGKAEE